jgi:outer membrane murein-binding lipoprotein Lpp
VLAGCGNAAQQDKIDELTKKVTTLEKRVKALETGHKAPRGKAGKAKAKAGKAKAPGSQAPKGTVEVTGDASKVMLTNGKRNFPVPGDLPAGEYTVLAAFDAAAEPAQAGTATVTAEKPITLDCKSAEKTCTAAPSSAP